MGKFFLNEKLTHPLIIIMSLWLVYFIFNQAITKLVNMKSKIKSIDSKKNKTVVSLIKNIAKYFLIIIGCIMILNVYGVNTNSILASLGVASAVIALAFQDVLKDLLAGICIVLENQYNIGDIVTINDFKGEVISIGLRTTRLKSYTGENCYISNHNVGDVVNHSISSSLAIVTVQVAYDTDLDKLESILNKFFEKIMDEEKEIVEAINYDGVDEFAESGITLRITAFTKPMKHIQFERYLRKEIKKEFDKNQIEIPYPHVVVKK